ncbi:MAG: hypothetical protein CO186_02010 [Zetaproteobacteria bacterium CG_4_9_14_3_um_filter_49_83]|nr:MAG: hypothetical protein AUJ56_01975 [Zetaproteobacteria bacterium CG1_02_49_23]PIQ34853.1 MAG: hypothetical protein COW62_00360 [Zetaproteobacteria bacterium CG17_big_fil_post_rev_8_21_14_2_50_50_13]PIV29164.1 MAG: hypothetical protein COS35_13505 [Zetaproteobacteria bacterium CG02_land_8_20_14_3_00_50_9]PIY55823.1 MAG: hypothetical protein COZ00_07710 [Zetaproteobacteria bacterium CG_4_10_14_0_8_um_filter_49_80]PJA36205.1 MAG: hypothetical protein CO186_02010 [Zetaproteobacteria bacterium
MKKSVFYALIIGCLSLTSASMLMAEEQTDNQSVSEYGDSMNPCDANLYGDELPAQDDVHADSSEDMSPENNPCFMPQDDGAEAPAVVQE